MDATHLHVAVNLDALLGELQTSLQTTINLVALSLQSQAQQRIDGTALRLPMEGFNTTFDARLTWSTDEAQERQRTWTLSNGLRDALEDTSSFLESARQVLAVWSMRDVQQKTGKLTAADWNKAMHADARAFHRLGLPDKLPLLTRQYDVVIDSTLADHLLSINAARNCLVHRRGVVGDRDVNCGGRLTVGWRKLSLILKDEDGEHPVVLNQRLEKESTLCLRAVDCSKSFEIGERIAFTVQEFADITWGLFSFGSALVSQINALGLAKGYVNSSGVPASTVSPEVTQVTQATPD